MVGPDQKGFIVHEKVISSLSKPLKALLTGSMKEAKEGRVVWDDVDEQTFVRFSQWAYVGDYDAGAPDIYLDHSTVSTDFLHDSLLIQTDISSDSSTPAHQSRKNTVPKPAKPLLVPLFPHKHVSLELMFFYILGQDTA